MTVLITDNGRVDQRVCDPGDEPDESYLAELRARINTELVGLGVGEVPAALERIVAAVPPIRAELVRAVAESIGEQVQATRRDRLVMAGAANLVRTESDFRGSIFPVLDAIEQQVTLLKLFGEIEIERAGVAASIGRENAGTGLEETTVLAGDYSSGVGGGARLGLVGPTRMDYSNNMAAVRAVARYVSRLLSED